MEASPIHAWLVLWKSARAVEAYAHASIRELRLGLSDFAVLEALLHKGPLLANEIGKRVLLTSGSVTAAIDRLARQELVERRSDPADRRACFVHLTPKGRNLIRKAFARHETDIDELMQVLGSKERAQLVESLRKLGQTAAELVERKSN